MLEPRMTLQESFRWLSGILGLAMYVPLVVDIVRRRGRGHSFAMWALWAILDTTATLSLVVQSGNYLLTAGFSVGSILLSVMLLSYRQFKWGRLESVVVILVLLCVAVWVMAGARAATIATTLAIITASIPGLVELWRHPSSFAARIWAGFTVANLLALMGGANWSVEERFAPAAFTLQTLVMYLAGNRIGINRLLGRASARNSHGS